MIYFWDHDLHTGFFFNSCRGGMGRVAATCFVFKDRPAGKKWLVNLTWKIPLDEWERMDIH